MKKLFWLLPLMAVAGAMHAQVTDTTQTPDLPVHALETLDTLPSDSIYLSPSVKALEEVKITAE